MNSIGKEIAREASAAAPLKRKLEGVSVGDTIYVGRHSDSLRPIIVDKITKAAVVSGPNRFRIKDGLGMGSSGFYRVWAHPETPKLKAALELYRLTQTFESELAKFRANPKNLTAERMMALMRIMNPEAWK